MKKSRKKNEKKMARSEHLPIYKKAMEIALYFEQIVRNFSLYITLHYQWSFNAPKPHPAVCFNTCYFQLTQINNLC